MSTSIHKNSSWEVVIETGTEQPNNVIFKGSAASPNVEVFAGDEGLLIPIKDLVEATNFVRAHGQYKATRKSPKAGKKK